MNYDAGISFIFELVGKVLACDAIMPHSNKPLNQSSYYKICLSRERALSSFNKYHLGTYYKERCNLPLVFANATKID